MIIDLLSVIIVVAALFYRFGRPYLIERRTKGAVDWPTIEGTIQSAKILPVDRVGHLRELLPFFDFSYVVDGEYYSGRFGLQVSEDRAAPLMRELIDTKVNLRYDPNRPSVFKLPDDLSVEGFRAAVVPEWCIASPAL